MLNRFLFRHNHLHAGGHCGEHEFIYESYCYQASYGKEFYPATTDWKFTRCTEGFEVNLEYLDRHNVNCDPGQALVVAKFEDCGGGNYRYKYKCRTSGFDQTTLQVLQTPCQRAHGATLGYLDRQNPACPWNKAMQGFQFSRCGGSGDDFRYEVRCVNAEPSRPTSAPTQAPTTPAPTFKPLTLWNGGDPYSVGSCIAGGTTLDSLGEHKIECPKYHILNEFKLSGCKGGTSDFGEYQFKAYCYPDLKDSGWRWNSDRTSGHTPCESIHKKCGPYTGVDGNTYYRCEETDPGSLQPLVSILEGGHVRCGLGSALHSVKVRKRTCGLQFDFTCLNANLDTSHTAIKIGKRERKSACRPIGTNPITALASFDVRCPTNMVMRGFRFELCKDSTLGQFISECYPMAHSLNRHYDPATLSCGQPGDTC